MEIYLHIFYFISLPFICYTLTEEILTNYEDLYELGMDAYKDGNWGKCVVFFNNALKAYSFHKNSVIDCRLQCKAKEFSSTSDSNSQYEAMFHEILEASNCLRRCKKLSLGQYPEEEVSHVMRKKFEERAPYNYIQFCYFKQNKVKEAASAAFTYYITHQDEKGIVETLQYYKSIPGVKQEDFVDHERKPYQRAYIKALEDYNDAKWEASAEGFEMALSLYFTEEERCRAGCEQGFTHNGFPDFINALADHYITVIVCKQKCLQKLSTYGMSAIDNYVADHYDYLQYAYYESNNLEKAFQSIANFLLFRPTDHEMLANKDYYTRTLRHSDDEFVPSQEVVSYVKMWQTLDKSLDFVREMYTLPGDVVSPNENELSAEDIARKQRILESFSKLGIKMMEDFKGEKDQKRFVVDGLIREDQCQAIADLARVQEVSETGIRQISVTEAMELVKKEKDFEISLRLMLRASESINAYMFAYFNVSGLFIQESKVVCRSAGEKWEKRLGEACVPQEDGTCYTANTDTSDFIAVAYLSEITDGTGKFYFMDDVKQAEHSFRPKCGRVIGFAGHSLHGINLSWKKERCAVITHLSLDKEKVNQGCYKAKELLNRLAKKHVEEMKNENQKEILEQFYKQGVSIVKTGEDLFGKERFAADGLSTQDECKELIELAQRSAITGDGYHGYASPLSEGEIFTGLSVKSAEKQGMSQGDGYQGDQAKFVSPYSKTEVFEGLNVTRTLELIDSDDTSAHSLQLLLDISDNSRVLVEKYFNLTKPLYFDYTHLVCRTAREGQESKTEELSHPVHSDNCMIQPNGSCIPDRLAYQQRHYSAIMYLNGDFEGGEFFFAHPNKSEQVSLQPQCGRLVAFNASEYHGVKGVRKGQRCAIAMWYTQDPNYIEVSRIHAQRRLDGMVGGDKSDKKDVDIVLTDVIPTEAFTEESNDHDEL